MNYYTVDEIAEGSARLVKADGTHSWMQLAELWERIEAGDYILNPVTPRTPFEQEMDTIEKALVTGVAVSVPEFDEFNAADFNSLLDQGGTSTGHRGVQKLDANGDPLRIGQNVRHVGGGDTSWFGKVVNFEAVPHDPTTWAVIVDAYYPTGMALGKRVVESYYLAPNPNPEYEPPVPVPGLAPEWDVTWPGEPDDPDAPLTQDPDGPAVSRAPLPDGWSEVIVNNQTLYVDGRGAMLDPTITEEIPLALFENFFAVMKGYIDSKPPGWTLKPREDGDKGNLAYIAPDGTTWVAWIPGDDPYRPLNVPLIEDAYAYDDALKELAAVQAQGAAQTVAIESLEEAVAQVKLVTAASKHKPPEGTVHAADLVPIFEMSVESMDEWQMTDHDQCSARWFFESVRRRMVEPELVAAFPLFYTSTGRTSKKRPS